MSVDPKEVKQVERALAQEAKHEIKSLTEAHKELDSAIRGSAKAFKEEEKAYAHQEKTAKLENKAAHEFVHLQHKHDNSKKDVQSGEEAMRLAKEHQERLHKEVEAKKGLVDEVTGRHHELVSERTSTIQNLRKAPTSVANPTAASPAFTRDAVTPNTITPTPIAAAHSSSPIDSKQPSSPLDANVEAKERAQAEDNARLEKKMAEANLGGEKKHVRIGEEGAQRHESHGVDQARKRSAEHERVGGGMNKGFVQPGQAL